MAKGPTVHEAQIIYDLAHDRHCLLTPGVEKRTAHTDTHRQQYGVTTGKGSGGRWERAKGSNVW